MVDIQNDFLPGGALPVREGNQIIPVINRLLPLFSLVVATQDWHPADHGSFASNRAGGKPFAQAELNGLPQTLWPTHCVQNTAGAELAAALQSERITRVFYKGTDAGIDSYSGFFDNGQRRSTGLGEWLKERGVTHLHICGLATDYCVKFTALDAARLGFHTYFIKDASRGIDLQPGDVAGAIAEMKRAGVITEQSTEFVKPLNPTVTLHASQFLALIREGHWEYVDRVNATGAALILAVTPEDKILLVEQYRIPVHARTIELPAGIIGDEPGGSEESQAEAARRELREETGYAAAKVEALTTGAACSGLTSERVTLFRATELRRVGAGGGVAQEAITVHEVSRKGISAWLEAKAKTGVLVDPKVYAGLFFLGQAG